MRIPGFLLTMILSGPPLFLQAEQPPPPTPDDAKEYVYKTVDGADLKLDVFSPPGLDPAKPRPGFIYIHGGGWTSGDKGWTYPLCRYFAQRGAVVVTVNYRFRTKGAEGVAGTKGICVMDVKSAIRWVRSHAKELGIDPDKIALGGSSAGSHLAVMAALGADFDNAGDDLKIPTSASALVLLSPAIAKVPPSQIKEPEPTEPYKYLKGTPPPQIMLAGDADHLVADSRAFLVACKAAGGKGELWLAPGEGHTFTAKKEWMDETCTKADAFLVSLGLLDGEPPKAGSVSFVKGE